MVIYELFQKACKDFGEKVALIYLGKRYSFSEIKEMVEKFAGSLLRLGVQEGDRVIIYLPNCPQWIISWLAVMRINAISVPISPVYTPTDLKYMINDSESTTIICADTNFGYVAEVFSETCLRRVIVTNIAELLPLTKRLIGFAFDRIPTGKVKLSENVYRFSKLLKEGSSILLSPFKSSEENIFEMLYTGGTTGQPKGVPYPHITFFESITEQRAQTEDHIPKGKDVIIQGGPLFHILGQALGLGGFLFGDTLILLPRVNIDAILDHIERWKALSFFGVPILYRMILEHERVDFYDISSLQYCFSGGDVLPVEVGERWLKKFGKPIYQGYGTTETCGRVSLTRMGQNPPPGSAGKVTPLQKVRIVDPDTLEPLPPSYPGELLVSSDHMVKAYWRKERETKECFVEQDGRLWYRTRDIVRIDDEGWLYYLDRSADVIKHKGYRVSASEVESTLKEHPCVVEACVVGVPDERVGERIKAFVVLKEDARGVSAYELMRWCRERLAPYKVPQYIEFRDMLPKSKVGKILRRELREEERKKKEI